MIKKDIIGESFGDIIQDFEELLYLNKTLLEKLNDFTREILKRKNHISKEAFDFILFTSDQLTNTLLAQTNKLENSLLSIKKNQQTPKNLFTFISLKQHYYNLLRVQTGYCAGLIPSTDFQSPSFTHSLHSQAGRQEGNIAGHINDYKRDHHLDGVKYEKAFLKEYIGRGILKKPVSVFLTQSGMAAFTTIVMYILMEKKIKGTVVIGRGIYFENKEIIKGLFKNSVIEVDESNTKEVLKTIASKKPTLVIFDSLCNAYGVEMPNLSKIFSELKKQKEETYCIIDTTALPLFCEPINKILGKKSNLKLFVFESINKYYQFGLDRTTGGVIYTSDVDKLTLFFAREHLGTNISDTSVLALPSPNKKLLKKRLVRHTRNALLLSSYISSVMNTYVNGPYEKVAYPGLSDHSSYSWTKNSEFYGSYFVIHFKPPYQKSGKYGRFIKIVINEAKKRNVDIVGGTTFGLSTTRIYLTSVNSKYGKPFLRVSVGTETLIEIENLKEVFKAAMDRYIKPVRF